MQLYMRSFFSDPGYDLKISWKVKKFIRQKLSDIIFNNYPIDPKYPGFDINFNITTNRNTVSVEVKGPVKDGRNKMEGYGIWLPYERIVKADNMLQEFLDCFFEAMLLFFRKHNVPDEVVLRVKKEVEEEVLNNEEYVYVESEF
jgi:hypothetical protein